MRDDATELRTFRRGNRVVEVLREIGIDFEGKKVVDLGTGFGSLAIAAAEAGAQAVVAVDVHSARLEAVASRGRSRGVDVRVLRANLLEGVAEVRDADIALLVGVVEYAGLWAHDTPVRELQARVLKTAFECLAPGGALVFASKNRLWPRFVIRDANTGQPLVNALPRPLADRLSQRTAGVPYRHHIHSPMAWAEVLHGVGFVRVESFLPFLSYQLPLLVSRRPVAKELRTARARVRTKEEYDLAWGKLGTLRATVMVCCSKVRMPVAHSVIIVARKPT